MSMANLTGVITLRPLLNCKDQEDPILIQSIRFYVCFWSWWIEKGEKYLKNHYYTRKDFLDQPGTGDYSFAHPNPPTAADGQPLLLDQVLTIFMTKLFWHLCSETFFHESLKGGFFIEAGAFDGESDSTSLHFELNHGWNGLLVEPHPLQVLLLEFNLASKKSRQLYWNSKMMLDIIEKPKLNYHNFNAF